jgi:hypothetical protein
MCISALDGCWEGAGSVGSFALSEDSRGNSSSVENSATTGETANTERTPCITPIFEDILACDAKKT